MNFMIIIIMFLNAILIFKQAKDATQSLGSIVILCGTLCFSNIVLF